MARARVAYRAFIGIPVAAGVTGTRITATRITATRIAGTRIARSRSLRCVTTGVRGHTLGHHVITAAERGKREQGFEHSRLAPHGLPWSKKRSSRI